MTATLGFLSVRHHTEHGYFGGYLIVNRLARPLEFHCTMPVKPSRAQQLLYGPTIDDFICGEQIAKALTSKAKLTPQLVLTDSSCVLAMSLVSELPIAKLAAAGADGNAAGVKVEPTGRQGGPAEADCYKYAQLRIPDARTSVGRSLSVADHQFDLARDSTLCQQDLETLIAELSSNFDLNEPFQRVAEALLEAHPTTKAA